MHLTGGLPITGLLPADALLPCLDTHLDSATRILLTSRNFRIWASRHNLADIVGAGQVRGHPRRESAVKALEPQASAWSVSSTSPSILSSTQDSLAASNGKGEHANRVEFGRQSPQMQSMPRSCSTSMTRGGMPIKIFPLFGASNRRAWRAQPPIGERNRRTIARVQSAGSKAFRAKSFNNTPRASFQILQARLGSPMRSVACQMIDIAKSRRLNTIASLAKHTCALRWSFCSAN